LHCLFLLPQTFLFPWLNSSPHLSVCSHITFSMKSTGNHLIYLYIYYLLPPYSSPYSFSTLIFLLSTLLITF
jgi:hypothetical protein